MGEGRETTEGEKTNELLELIGLKATVRILRYLDEHGDTPYMELLKVTSTYTLTMRLRSLRRLGLVEHHIEKKNRRREWYTITEKGRRVLGVIREILRLLEDEKRSP